MEGKERLSALSGGLKMWHNTNTSKQTMKNKGTMSSDTNTL